MMKNKFKDIPLTLEEVREIMRKEDSKKMMWAGIAVGVIAVLVGIIIWLAKKSCKDIEEHYEYFDDYEDDVEEDDDYENFDDDIYEDEDEEVEYVKIKDFMNYDEESKEETAEEGTKTADELEKDEIQEDTEEDKKEN